MKTINNELIRSFHPCYDPSEKCPDNETLPVLEWVEKYRETVPAKDIIWLLCRNEFLSDKELRLFAVWCARDALKIIENPDARSIEACNVAERFANGDATTEELDAASDASWAAWASAGASSAAWAASAAAVSAARDAGASRASRAAACAVAESAAYAAASDATWSAARAAANDAAWDAMEAQLNELLNYFK